MLLGSWDLLLVAVVSLQATAMAYMHARRWQALLMSLPFPFTTLAIGLGNPIQSTHMACGLATGPGEVARRAGLPRSLRSLAMTTLPCLETPIVYQPLRSRFLDSLVETRCPLHGGPP